MNVQHVLVVDDDDVDREKLRRLLSRCTDLELSIDEASSGLEARKKLKNDSFDCIILDYRLGDVLGTDLIPEIKSHRDDPCSILMVTGLGDEGVAVEAMREGVYDYISKNNLQLQAFRAALEGGLNFLESERKNKESEERLNYLSFYDSLTGLPNRNLFFDRLNQAIHAASRGADCFTVLMMDLNLFKEVNDNLGHEAGDYVLSQVAQRLETVVRRSDTIARLGGDEFAALLIGTDNEYGAKKVAEKISKALELPIMIGEHVVTIGIAIGIAIFPFHGTDGKALLARADHAMYSAKRSEKNMDISANSEIAVSNNSVLMPALLVKGVSNGELLLHYQPKIHLSTHAVVGVEALVRWNSPQYGLLNPDQFISMAERSHAIRPLTYAVMEMALKQIKEWKSQGWHLPVAINLSPRMFTDTNLICRIEAIIAKYSLPPEMITLEITETAIMNDPDRAREIVLALLEIGIKISIDDFGTGFTSFKYFREIDVSEIKIDRIFVSHLTMENRDAHIIRSIAALADGLNVALVAEGIETSEAWSYLNALGCELGQGYNICHPLPADQIIPWLKSWTSAVQSQLLYANR